MIGNKGFTLIELVIVIIVLGILAATAVPKYINIQNDARTAVLKGVEASIFSSIDIAYAKLAIDGLEQVPSLVDNMKINAWCTRCVFEYGYPGQYGLTTWSNIIEGLAVSDYIDSNIKSSLITVGYADISSGALSTVFTVFTERSNYEGGSLQSDNCYVEYTPVNEVNSRPIINLVECK